MFKRKVLVSINRFLFILFLHFWLPSEKLLNEHAANLADLHKNLAQKEDIISMLSKEVTELKKDLAFCKQQMNRSSSRVLKKESPNKFTACGEALMTTDCYQDPQQDSAKEPLHTQRGFRLHPWIQEYLPNEVCCNPHMSNSYSQSLVLKQHYISYP